MTQSMVVVANPRPNSFVHALAEEAAAGLTEAGHEVVLHDLYAEGFRPVLEPEEGRTTRRADENALTVGADPLVHRHRRELSAARTLIVAHPNWWGKPPAIMAGWMDRVLVPGVVYELDAAEGEPTCLLDLRRLIVLNTGDTPAERETGVFGDPLSLDLGAVRGGLPGRGGGPAAARQSRGRIHARAAARLAGAGAGAGDDGVGAHRAARSDGALHGGGR